MNKIWTLILALLASTSAFAGTYRLEQACQDKIAQLSEALIAVNLNHDENVISVDVNPMVSAVPNGALVSAHAKVTAKTSLGVKTSKVIVKVNDDVDDGCAIKAATLN